MRRFKSLRRAATMIGLGLLIAGPASAQGDALAGRKKAEICATCHGLDGLAKIAEAPNLAGQNEAYLVEQLTSFQSGARNNDMMSIVVKNLSDTDIANLAAYYAGIQIKVGKIPGQ